MTYHKRLPPIGRPIPNSQVYILAENLALCPLNVPGELHLGGIGLARSYLNRPDLTAEKFIANPFATTVDIKMGNTRLYKTGDLCRWLSDGNIEYMGRIDSQVKIRGFRIELGEIETQLQKHPEIKEAAVLAREDVPGNKQLVAYYQVKNPAHVPEANQLQAYLRSKLPEYMIPTFYMSMDAFPLTSSGKLNRKALPQPQLILDIDEYQAPRTLLEEGITAIWKEILPDKMISIQDNFFELGGHSLLATQVISRIKDQYHIDLPLQQLFKTPTIAGLADYISAGAKQTEQESITPISRNSFIPLSFAQQRLWFLDQLQPGNNQYNLPTLMKITGLLNTQALECALNQIIARHEVLRTTIVTDAEGQAQQIIAPPLKLSLLLETDLDEPTLRAHILAQAQQGFNLQEGPLLRATLFKLDEKTHLFLLNFHHIITDAWSSEIFNQELAQYYQAVVDKVEIVLQALPIQYADFSVWQRKYLSPETSIYQKQLAYWEKRLANIPPLLELPTDKPRPLVQSFRGQQVFFQLSPTLKSRIHALSAESGATSFMIFLTVFYVLLYRYTGQTDLVVGSPIANRNRKDIEKIMGFFVNTLALRVEIAENSSFMELLAQVKQCALEAYDHQDIPFERLVEILKVKRSLSYSPVFQTMFVLTNED